MTPTSRNLENISKQTPTERRRLFRLSLCEQQFRLNPHGKVFSVPDLSSQGLSLRVLDAQDLFLFPVGGRIDGTLNLDGQKLPVSGVIKHVGKDRVGCQFENIGPEVSRTLERALDPARLGAQLKPIPASESGQLWFHGPSGTDLLFWQSNEGGLRRFALYALGLFTQWDENEGLSTGRTYPALEAGEARGAIRLETLLLERDDAPDSEKLAVAKNLLLSSNLPQDLKSRCLRQLDS